MEPKELQQSPRCPPDGQHGLVWEGLLHHVVATGSSLTLDCRATRPQTKVKLTKDGVEVLVFVMFSSFVVLHHRKYLKVNIKKGRKKY